MELEQLCCLTIAVSHQLDNIPGDARDALVNTRDKSRVGLDSLSKLTTTY